MVYFIVALIGGLIGLAELVGRYPDSPIAALKNYASAIYALINSVASMVTLLFLQEFSMVTFEGVTDQNKELVEILIAGLGASAILRVGLNIQVAGRSINISLMTILEPILKAADSEVDRARGAERLRITRELMVGLDVSSAFNDLPPLCLYLLQGIPEEKQKELADEVKTLELQKMQDNMKLMSLGLALMNTVGSDVLEKSVDALKDFGPGASKGILDDVSKTQEDDESEENTGQG